MKLAKLQQDILKAAVAKDTKRKMFEIFWYESEDSVCISPNGFYMVVIPKERFYLSLDKVFTAPPTNFAKFLDVQDLEIARDTGTIVKSEAKTLHVFKVGDEEVYLDESNLKYFDLDICTFKGINRISPIFIYEYDLLVGMVLPMNRKGV